MGKRTALGSLLVLFSAVAACGNDGGGSAERLAGTVSVEGDVDWMLNSIVALQNERGPGEASPGKRLADGETVPCPSSPSQVVGEGNSVVVTDADQTTVATAKLGTGTIFGTPSDEPWGCVFSFDASIPRGSDFYTVAIDGAGEETYSADDLEAMKWTIELEFG